MMRTYSIQQAILIIFIRYILKMLHPFLNRISNSQQQRVTLILKRCSSILKECQCPPQIINQFLYKQNQTLKTPIHLHSMITALKSSIRPREELKLDCNNLPMHFMLSTHKNHYQHMNR